jgi:hypothetical protein
MALSIPKFNYYRSKKHLQNVADLPCQHCGMEGQTQAAHSNWAKHGKGRGIKASDEYTAALCYPCHAQLDQGMCLSKEERQTMWDNAYMKTLSELQKRGLWIK